MAYRPTERTEHHRVQRSDALVKSACAIVARQGFAAATVSAVARRAGVSTGTVYTYFPDKSALITAVFASAAGVELDHVRASVQFGTHERLQLPALRRLETLVRVFGSRALRGRQLAWALLFEPADASVERERLIFRRAYADTVSEILEDAMAEGTLPLQPVAILAPAIVGAIGESLIGPLAPLSEVEAAEHNPLSADIVLDALTAFCLSAVGATPPVSIPDISSTASASPSSTTQSISSASS